MYVYIWRGQYKGYFLYYDLHDFNTFESSYYSTSTWDKSKLYKFKSEMIASAGLETHTFSPLIES